MATSLNCSSYDVYVALRGGTTLVCNLKGTESINFSRKINDVSDAKLSIAVNTDCADCLAALNPWQHEVLIFRSGTLVWCGPIVSIGYRTADSRVDLHCRDLFSWTDRRLIEILGGVDYEVEEVDVAEVFNWVLTHGYEKDPWFMDWTLLPTGVPISRYYPAVSEGDRWGGKYTNVGQELRSLSQAGIDYTVINRSLVAGDLVATPPVQTVLKVSDQTWVRSPDITVNGASMSTRTVGAGGSGGFYGWYDDQVWIAETAGQPWGLHETFVTLPDLSDTDTTETPNAITQEIEARHAVLKQPVAMIQGGQLSGTAPFDFNDLIPGLPVQVGFLKPLRTIEVDYRMYALKVEVSPEAEAISMDLSVPGLDGVAE